MDELNVNFQGSGATLYAVIRTLADLTQVWNGTAFETFAGASIATYDIPLNDRGGDVYAEDFPEDVDAGNYLIQYYEQAGGTPATSDLLLDTQTLHWSGDTTSDPTEDPSGTYYSWTGIKNILGQTNAEVSSQLDQNVTSADLSRVAYNGELADAETNRRARIAGKLTPIASTSGDFILVQQATDLYASWMLVMHREWFENVGTLTDEQRAGLEKRYLDAYRRLFGEDDVGVDAEEDSDDETPSAPGTFRFVSINRGTNCTDDEYSNDY